MGRIPTDEFEKGKWGTLVDQAYCQTTIWAAGVQNFW